MSKSRGLRTVQPLEPLAKNLGWVTSFAPDITAYAELARMQDLFIIPLSTWQIVSGICYAHAIRGPAKIPTESFLSMSLSLLFATYVFHAAGCVWNDVIDQDLDRQTRRCKTRPIARGAVSTTSAVLYAMCLAGVSCVSFVYINPGLSIQTIGYGTCTLVGTIIYPFLKRITDYPQVELGSIFACSFLCAAQAVLDLCQSPIQTHLQQSNPKSTSAGSEKSVLFSNKNTPSTIFLFLAVLLSIVLFDITYALSDVEDDLRSGVRGMAVRFRNCISRVLGVIKGLVLICLLAAGWSASFGVGYFVLVVGGVAAGFRR